MHYLSLFSPIVLGCLALPTAADPDPGQCGFHNGKYDLVVQGDTCTYKCIPSVDAAKQSCLLNGGSGVVWGRYSWLRDPPKVCLSFCSPFPFFSFLFFRVFWGVIVLGGGRVVPSPLGKSWENHSEFHGKILC